MDFFVSLMPQIPDFILALVGLLTVTFLVLFIWRYVGAENGLRQAIVGLKLKLDSHNGRDPTGLDSLFSKQPLHHIWSEYSETLHPMTVGVVGQASVEECPSSNDLRQMG